MSETLLSFADRGTKIADNVLQLIGNTPMVYLSKKINDTKATIALKLEGENPMASVKDRLALAIISDAEKAGKITPGKSTIVEATSGNTGVALAMACAVRGYKLIIVMPEQMSLERRALLQVLGADMFLTPAALGMKGAKRKAAQLLREIPDSFDSAQFETPSNAKIHYETTGPEIWQQTQGKVDVLVSGVGTGGTVSGTGRFLREKKASVKVFAVEPDESAVINGEPSGAHKIQGMGAGFVPEVLDRAVLEACLRVKSADALSLARKLPLTDGLFVGISAGAIVQAALDVARRPDSEGKLIVAIIPSFGERYLSTALFNDIREAAAKWPVVPASELPDPAAAAAAAPAAPAVAAAPAPAAAAPAAAPAS
jgi:cysteine synthase A